MTIGLDSEATDTAVPDDPFITATGIRVLVIADGLDGGSGVYACEADAMVNTLAGEVVEILKAPEVSDVEVGERVFPETSGATPSKESTLLGSPVYRGEVGTLIAGWRTCEPQASG